MSDYTPIETEIVRAITGTGRGKPEARRGIAKVKADALREAATICSVIPRAWTFSGSRYQGTSRPSGDYWQPPTGSRGKHE